MLTIDKTDVPEYLKRGQLFLSLSDNDDDNFEVPENSFKLDATVTDSGSLHNLLSSLRYWMVEDVPNAVLDVALLGASDTLDVIKAFTHDWRHLSDIECVCKCSKEFRLEKALECKNMQIVNFLIQDHAFEWMHHERFYLEGCNIQRKRRISTYGLLALHGHLDMFDMTHTQEDLDDAVIFAARGGHVNVLEYVHLRGGKLEPDSFFSAVEKITCVQYIHRCGIRFPAEFAHRAIETDSLEVLKYSMMEGCHVSEKAILGVRSSECISVLHTCGFQWTAKCSVYAAYKGLDVLKRIHEVGCPLSHRAAKVAASFQSADTLKYLRENGCMWNEDVIYAAVSRDRWECMEYAVKNGCPVPEHICTFAATCGNLRTLKFFHRRGFALEAWDIRGIQMTAEKWKCKRYIHKHLLMECMHDRCRCVIQ